MKGRCFTPRNSKSFGRRIVLSIVLGLVGCGLSFYVILFAVLIAGAFGGDVNSAVAPGVRDALRHFALPFSLTVGFIAAVIGFRRKSAQDRSAEHVSEQRDRASA